jgi:hypothetical protein
LPSGLAGPISSPMESDTASGWPVSRDCNPQLRVPGARSGCQLGVGRRARPPHSLVPRYSQATRRYEPSPLVLPPLSSRDGRSIARSAGAVPSSSSSGSYVVISPRLTFETSAPRDDNPSDWGPTVSRICRCQVDDMLSGAISLLECRSHPSR